MRPDCRPECFRPPLLEYSDHSRRDIVDGTRSIDRDDRTRLWVTALPCTISEPLESCGDPVVKVIVGGFDRSGAGVRTIEWLTRDATAAAQPAPQQPPAQYPYPQQPAPAPQPRPPQQQYPQQQYPQQQYPQQQP